MDDYVTRVIAKSQYIMRTEGCSEKLQRENAHLKKQLDICRELMDDYVYRLINKCQIIMRMEGTGRQVGNK
jgi:hypothetical protein